MATPFRVPRQPQRITLRAVRLDPDAESTAGALDVTPSRRPQALDPRVTVTSTDPAAGLDPTDVRWGGVIQVRPIWRELLGPLGCVATPPLLSLGAWLLTGDPVWLIGTGITALVVLTAVDRFRGTPGT